jgi:hypothetical protein
MLSLHIELSYKFCHRGAIRGYCRLEPMTSSVIIAVRATLMRMACFRSLQEESSEVQSVPGSRAVYLHTKPFPKEMIIKPEVFFIYWGKIVRAFFSNASECPPFLLHRIEFRRTSLISRSGSASAQLLAMRVSFRLSCAGENNSMYCRSFR